MNKPRVFGWLFFVTILVFGALIFVNALSFKGIDGIGSALYFSIVTITTLGFGDVTPKDGTGQLLVCLEALIGVTLVGLFLNAISSRQAEKMHQNELLVLEKRRFMDMQGKLRQNYLNTKDLRYWKMLIQALPDSWLQTRTVTMDYENLLAMCSPGQRRFHKLTEWSEDFIKFARQKVVKT